MSFQKLAKDVHYEAFLPDDMKDLLGNKRIENKIFKAWFSKAPDSDDFDYPPSSFMVTLDRCEVQFVRDPKLSGLYHWGDRRGQKWRVVKGTVTKYSASRLLILNRQLNHVATSLNEEIMVTEKQRKGGNLFA